MPKVRKNTTLCKISFYTHDPIANRIDTFTDLLGTQPPIGPVVSWSYQDRLGQAAGQVQIKLKPRIPPQTNVNTNPLFEGKTWSEVLNDGDWWVIDALKNGIEYRIGFGRIDSIGVEMIPGAAGEGQVIEIISGRTFGFGLEDTPIYFNPFDASVSAVQLAVLDSLGKFAGSTDEILVPFLETVMGKNSVRPDVLLGHNRVPVGIGTPDQVSWIGLCNTTKHVQTGLRGAVTNPSLVNIDDPFSSQTLWATLDAWRNPTLNELFVDTDLDTTVSKASLVLREKPFVNATQGITSPWFQLTKTTIDASTIQTLSLQKGLNRINHFLVMGSLTAEVSTDQYAAYKAKVDDSSLGKHGLRRLHETSNYFENIELQGVIGAAASVDGAESWTNIVASWNVLNHLYFSGLVTSGEMVPKVRKGTRLFVENGPPVGYSGFPTDLGVELAQLSFYVEGFMHTWTEGEHPTAQTQIMVSRGFVEGSRALEVPPATLALVILPAASANDPIDLDSINILSALESLEIDAAIQIKSAVTEIKVEKGS